MRDNFKLQSYPFFATFESLSHIYFRAPMRMSDNFALVRLTPYAGRAATCGVNMVIIMPYFSFYYHLIAVHTRMLEKVWDRKQ